MTDTPNGNKIGVYNRNGGRTAPSFSLILPARKGFNLSDDMLMGPVNGSSESHVFTVDLSNLASAASLVPISHHCNRISSAFSRREYLDSPKPLGAVPSVLDTPTLSLPIQARPVMAWRHPGPWGRFFRREHESTLDCHPQEQRFCAHY